MLVLNTKAGVRPDLSDELLLGGGEDQVADKVDLVTWGAFTNI